MTLRVNGVEIPESAVRFELNRLVKFYSDHMSMDELHKQLPLLRRKACEQAIGARLLLDEADRREITVDADAVNEKLDTMIENAGGRAGFEELLRKQGLSEDQVRHSIEQGIRVDALVDQIAADVEDPSEEQLRAHFEAHRKEYRHPDRAQARHILIQPQSESEEDRQTARSRLEEIRHRITEENADFADQAAAHSECPSGRQSGGSLGWVPRGTMVPEFNDALFAMNVDDLSDVIETPLGMHLIQKTDQQEGEEAGFDEARDRVRDFLRHAARGEAIKAFVEELKKNAVIEED